VNSAHFRPRFLIVLYRARNLETYLIFCTIHVCLNILHMCTDAVHEAQFTSSKWTNIIGKMITVAWTFRKQLTCSRKWM